MSDAQRNTPSFDPSDWDVADRDTRVEQLLLSGLDHYFVARYDEAINVWTRVLFLDRGHARACAYIERARSAQAERQRESLEILHHGVDAFDRGDADAARQLLSHAVERGAPQEEALALLERMDRLDVASGRTAAVPETRGRRKRLRGDQVDETRPSAPSLALPLALLAVAAMIVVAGLYLWTHWGRVDRWFAFDRTGRTAGVASVSAAPLVVPPASEAALARVRALLGQRSLRAGSAVTPDDARVLREALRALDAVKVGDPLRAEADRLRADIQRALIASAGPAAPAPPGARPGNPQ
jgi:hypothetical protein